MSWGATDNVWRFGQVEYDQPNDRLLVAGQEVELDRTELQLRNGFTGRLKKGMTLQARFMVTERTLFQLLRDDVNDWLNPVAAG